MLISNALDQINEGSSPKEIVVSLDFPQMREAALLHASALLRMTPTSITNDTAIVGGLNIILTETDVEPDISYADIGKNFRVGGAKLNFCDGPSRLSLLLELLWYGRDRSDTLLFLPPEQRSDRIADLALKCEASEDFVRVIMRFCHFLQSEKYA